MTNAIHLRQLLEKMHASRVELAQRLTEVRIVARPSARLFQRVGLPIGAALAVAALFPARRRY
jgi:hypothetical protein